MARTIIVGDVHGCMAELRALLDKVKYEPSDSLVLVGDLVARGPDSRAVVAFARKSGALVVRGNHEDKLLRWYAAKRAHARGKRDRPRTLAELHEEVATSLRKSDWAFLAATPLWIDLREHGLRVVHAGVLPGVPINKQEKRTLLSIRSLGPDGEARERGGRILWGMRYEGPPHIVFGHNAKESPQLHPWATGLDTSCVYGGRLTALVLDRGERVPVDLRKRRRRLVSVPARRAYFDGAKGRPAR